jgi:hypothetical protein
MISLRQGWLERHPEVELIDCPHCPPGTHLIEVCADCGWPPALDGRCRCEVDE